MPGSDDVGADEFLVDFFGLAAEPDAPQRGMDAYWGRHVFNRTLRCAEAGCALALLDWPAADVGKETELAARPTCESFRLSDSVRPKLFFVKQMLNF